VIAPGGETKEAQISEAGLKERGKTKKESCFVVGDWKSPTIGGIYHTPKVTGPGRKGKIKHRSDNLGTANNAFRN